MSNRTVVCDIQGFRGLKNEFIVKEAAFLTTSGSKVQSIIFKPPFPYTALPETQQKVATWVKHFCHGMDWNDGYTPYFEMKNIFNRILGSYDVVLVKGMEKKIFIENILSNKTVSVRDMDETCCPRINDLRKQMSFRKCFYHSRATDQCASENVRLLLHWYINKVEKKSTLLEIEDKTVDKIGEIIDKFNTLDKYGNRTLANLKIQEISYLPKEYFVHHVSPSDLWHVWDLLPDHKKDKLKDIIYCYEHYNSSGAGTDHIDGKPQRKENCARCTQSN